MKRSSRIASSAAISPRNCRRASAFQQHFASATPAIVFPRATVERTADDRLRLAGGITALGVSADFWRLGPEGGPAPARLPGEGEIVLNQPLAEELGAEVGDSVTVRLVKANQVPADSPLGRKSDRTRSLPNLEVIEIVPAEGLGRFSLTPSQHLPRNAYLPMEVLESVLDQRDRANAIFVAGRSAEEPPSEERANRSPRPWRRSWPITASRWTASPARFSRRRHARGDDLRLLQLHHRPDDLQRRGGRRRAQDAFAPYDAQPVFTYLANLIEKIPADAADEPVRIPYSTIASLDSTAELGPLLDETGEPLILADDEIVLVDWAAEQLGAEVGDTIRISYFAPETTHGQTTELSAEFRLAAIAPLTTPARPYSRRRPAEFDERPRLTNDPDLTPVVEGITDQATIDSWDAPFPMLYRVRSEDDEYWEDHRTTPKAYISPGRGQELWGSRFGRVTSFRIPADRVPASDGKSGEQVLEAAFLEQLEQSGALGNQGARNL
jgi:putative ABC transport system permease protein